MPYAIVLINIIQLLNFTCVLPTMFGVSATIRKRRAGNPILLRASHILSQAEVAYSLPIF